jgi:hypothetical protein
MNLSFESKVSLVTGAAGASATVAMTHIDIQEALNGKVVEWMEKVTDDQTQFCHRKCERDELQV